MKIKKIEISNFKSIKSAEFSFEDIQGLWEINGPVGAGKTSIGEALLYGLFGTVRDKNIPDLIKWGEKKMQVNVELTSKGHELRIERSAGTGAKFNVYVDEVLLKTSSKKDTQKKLEDDYYDLSKLTLETLCVISFNGFKSLATLTPANARAFLNNTFGLSILSDYAALANSEKSSINGTLNELKSKLTGINGKISVYDKLKNSGTECSQDDLGALRVTEREKSSKYTNHQNEYAEELKTLNSSVNEIATQQAVIMSKGKKLKSDIDFLSKGICPTCGAKLDNSHLEEYNAERNRLLTEYKELDEKKNEINNEKESKSVDFHAKCSVLNVEIKDIEYKISEAEKYLKNRKLCEDNLDELNSSVLGVKEDIQRTENEIAEWSELSSVLERDIRYKIISNIIPSLNSRISYYTSELECPYDIEFNDDFKCTIIINGIGNIIPITSLSTGQLKTVDMVIIMAILDILIGGIDFNIHFLDELLSNMDEDLREKMCSILWKNHKDGQTIFIISHAKLPADLIDGTIQIVNKNNESTISIK